MDIFKSKSDESKWMHSKVKFEYCPIPISFLYRVLLLTGVGDRNTENHVLAKRVDAFVQLWDKDWVSICHRIEDSVVDAEAQTPVFLGR